jgi:ABC-type sulfate transport system permease component
LLRRKITEALDSASSNRVIKYGVYLASVIVFLALILVPPIIGIITKFGAVQQIFAEPSLVARVESAVTNSFGVALFVSAVDVLAGLPMAWLIARGKSRWLNVVDTLADIPFVVPTSALGYSLLLFWNRSEGISAFFGGSLVSEGWLLVILLHFTFSYPVVVRVLVGALLDYKVEYERASRTLGAPPLTAARTVTLSILRPSLIAAFILAFARSLSETGATFIVAGLFENGPVFIQNITNGYKAGIVNAATYEGSIVLASLMLMVVASAIFAFIRVFGPRLKLPTKGVWPGFERKLSYSKASSSRNGVTMLIFLAIVLIPSLWVALPAFQAVFTTTLHNSLFGVGVWSGYWQSLLLSYLLAGTVTILNLVIGLPMAILIARKRLGALTSTILDVLVMVPLIVPSIALGVSLTFFWKQTFAFIPEIWLLIFAHLTITYPYFVRSASAAVERISVDMEEAARTLGAKPLSVFRTIIFPLTKYSILSGAIIVFTRSMSETGATAAVASKLQTAPLIIVNWVKIINGPNPSLTPLDIGLGCGILILFSFVILLILRFISKEKGRS